MDIILVWCPNKFFIFLFSPIGVFMLNTAKCCFQNNENELTFEVTAKKTLLIFFKKTLILLILSKSVTSKTSLIFFYFNSSKNF